MARQPKNAAAIIGLIIWLLFLTAYSAYILYVSPERGSGIGGTSLVMLGIFGGGVSLLFAMLAVLPLNRGKGTASLLIRLIVAASFFGLIGVVRYGNYLYRLDQEEAKRFVDRRVAEVRATATDAPFPATQDEFVNNKPLPRLLRNQKFYFREGGNQFRIQIRVDFDGGWIYSSYRPMWVRST